MAYNCTGTTDKSDLMLEIHPYCSGLIIFNLVPNLNDKKLREKLKKF